MYLVIEGINGAGKTALISSLSKQLARQNITAIRIEEPTLGVYGREARRLMATQEERNLKEEHRLFTLDRQEHVEKKIRPLLKFIKRHPGFILLQDRGYLSAPVYQAETDDDMERLLEEQRNIAPRPDHFIILDLPEEIALERIQARAKGASMAQMAELKRIRRRYLQLAEKVEESILVLVDKRNSPILYKHVLRTLGLDKMTS